MGAARGPLAKLMISNLDFGVSTDDIKVRKRGIFLKALADHPSSEGQGFVGANKVINQYNHVVLFNPWVSIK